MINLIKKLFNITPSERDMRKISADYNRKKNTDINEKKRETISEKSKACEQENNGMIMPLLIGSASKTINIRGQLVQAIHQNAQGENTLFVILSAIYNINDEEGTIGSIDTSQMSEDEHNDLSNLAQKNLDEFEFDFTKLEINDLEIDFNTLTLPINTYSSESMLSPIQMKKAQKMLNTDRILVSIAKADHIFLCSNNISDKQRKEFIKLHYYVLFNDDIEQDILSEDLFILKDGEIENICRIPNLREKLFATVE